MTEEQDKASESLKRIQEFDPESLPRESELGQALSFKDAVKPARRLVRLYKQLSLSVLEDLPDKPLSQIATQANADYNRLHQILDFKADIENPKNQRDALIHNIEQAYPSAFNVLHNFIAYGMSKSVDFQRMENDARALLQSVQDDGSKVTAQLQSDREKADAILEDIRKVAAETGVSQQAHYFKEESESHSTKAEEWRNNTIKLAWMLGIYAFLSIFLHKIPWLAPTSAFQSVQLIASKILIFTVLSYMLFLAARNFMSHKHNAVVNKHRQNALMTFKALADAASDEQQKGLVLTHASACIFSPQETGYSKGQSDRAGGLGRTAVELIPRAMVKIDG